MQGPPGGGGWNPGGVPPGGPAGGPPGAWNQGGAQSQPGTPQAQPGAPARTVALSTAELVSAHGAPQAGAPGAYQPAPAVVQAVDARPVPTNVGVWVGLLFFAVGTMGCLMTGAAAATLGERQSMMVSYLGVPLAVAGLVAPLAGALTRSQSQPVAIGAPIGCGCVTMIASAVGLVAFYQLIWPSL